MKKLLLLVFALVFLAGCGRGRAETPEPLPRPVVDMTQMPLIIENTVAGPSLLRAAPPYWQEALRISQDGFTLVPLALGETGVCVRAAFALSVPPGTAVPRITIDGQSAPGIEADGEDTFIITPAAPLAHNTLYTFRLEIENGETLTWVFQTTAAFGLLSVFPAHESVNVPANTGIELHFSLAGFSDVRPHFSIEPSVEGRFIQRGTVVIFMPTNPLEYGQVYTVTLAAGVGLAGTMEKLAQDVAFSFETEPDGTDTREWWHDPSFHFGTHYTELPSFEPPLIRFRLNYPHRGTRPEAQIEVFRFGSEENAVEAIQRFFTAPHWAWVSRYEYRIATDGLERVARMTIREPHHVDEWQWMEAFELPDALPPGFYVINASIDGEINDQMLLQITDLAVQIIADDDITLVWVNDMTTGAAVENAAVRDVSRRGHADAHGIVLLPGGLTDSEDRLIIEAPDGKRAVMFYALHVQQPFFFRHHWWGSPQPSVDYWTALQLDRTLFQRSDTLNFWGFVQNRSAHEEIDYLTAVVSEGWGWGWGWMGANEALLRRQVSVQRGAYHGEIKLPHLDPGWYILTLYHGDIVVGTVHFEVQDFVKPPYEMTLSADRRAIFMWETVSFTARTAFFEGTPVPDLPLSYGVWGWPVNVSGTSRSAVTDLDGEVSVSVGPFTAGAEAQGWGHINFNAEATLPEIGFVWQQHNVMVFVNDINVQTRASREGAQANLTVDIHNITLDRLNDGTSAHSGDFLCAPVANHNVDVEIVRVYWVATRIGERYCFINRVVVPRYRHDRREQVIQRFTLTTDADGNIDHDFTVPNVDGESYIARISTVDGNGRRIQDSVFIGRDWWNFMWRAESGEPFLDGGRGWDEGYDIGDEVRLTLMSGTEKITRGNFLFIIAANGIIEYRVGVNPLVLTFGEKHLPNATVYAIFFNGHTYHSNWNMRETLRFNHESRQLSFEIETCQEAYRPGQTATVTLRVTDPSGNPVQTHVNLSAVDEALFALRDYTPDTLLSLYRHIPSGIRHRVATHRTFLSDGHDDGTVLRTGRMYAADAMPMPAAAPAAEMAMDDADGARAGDTHIRETFMDTALFFSARTDEQGVARITFRVPDNITSWRLTASGITDRLYAGNAAANLIVTQPLFVHYSMNDIFLVGDVPVLGVNAYGTSLTPGQRLTFTVQPDAVGDEAVPDVVLVAEGYAFARVNIPLWEMRGEGMQSILIRVTCENGLSDVVRHTFTVVESHRLVDTAVFYEVTPGMRFAPGGPGLTQITFSDLSRSQFMNTLFTMRHHRGNRIEGLVLQREATRLLNTYFPEKHLFTPPCGFIPLVYQHANGGIAILPHAEGDLVTTVYMMPFIMDEVSRPALRNFLLAAFDDPMQNNVLALYGLALLGEPVLLHLHAFAQAENITLANEIYLALAFAALGDTHNARLLYAQRVQPRITAIAPFYRIEADTRAQILHLTAAAARLASLLGMPEHSGLHEYTLRSHTADMRVRTHRLAYVAQEIQSVNLEPATITYTWLGEEITRDISGWRTFTLRIPSQSLHEFAIIATTGEVGAVSVHRIPLEEIEPAAANLTVTRQFFLAGENEPRMVFDQGDLVRVQISVDYSRIALTGSYMITDFLPAGLVHVQGSARAGDHNTTPGRQVWATVEGQRVQFFDWYSPRHRRPHEGIFYYYARVINPGTFRAEGTIVQNMEARGYMAVGEDGVITIR